MTDNSDEVNNYIDKMQDILNWAEDETYYRSPAHPNNENFNFDTKFIESVLTTVKRTKRISEKQKNCVDKIYNAFKIDKHVEWYC